jgi:hypothetical protein
MNFLEWFSKQSISGIDILLTERTPPPVLADWLEERGYNDSAVLAGLRGRVDKNLVIEMGRSAYIDKNPTVLSAAGRDTNRSVSVSNIDVGIGYYGHSKRGIIWQTPTGTNEWYSFFISCHPNVGPREVPMGTIVEKFSVSISGARWGATSGFTNFQGAVSQLINYSAYRFGHKSFDEDKLTGTLILLWAFDVQEYH